MTPLNSSQIFLKFCEIVINMTELMSFEEFSKYHKIIEVFQVTERRPYGATIKNPDILEL